MINVQGIISALDIDWSSWKNLPLNTLEDIRVWIGNYQVYLDKAKNYLLNFPDSDAAQAAMN